MFLIVHVAWNLLCKRMERGFLNYSFLFSADRLEQCKDQFPFVHVLGAETKRNVYGNE